MNLEFRPRFTHVSQLAVALLALGACGDDEPMPDAPTMSGIDAAPGLDAPPASNPAMLWLNDVNGNEGSLRLVGQSGPPSPF